MGDTPPPDQDFRSLYQTTLTPLRRYLATVLGNPHEAQDIAHDAYLRTYAADAGTGNQPAQGVPVYHRTAAGVEFPDPARPPDAT